MTIRSSGFDETRGVDLYQCDVCGELYGKLPGSVPLRDCSRCAERQQTAAMKERIHAGHKSAITLANAIQKHRESTLKSPYYPTPDDEELWATLDDTNVPNEAPSGIVAMIDDQV